MVDSGLDYKHFFVVKDGETIYENKEMLSYFMKRLNGKRGYMLIREHEEEISPNQYAFYFGGIIRIECMASNCFAGLTDKQIHQVLLEEVRGQEIVVTRPDGSSYYKTVTDDFGAFGKKKMSQYIDEVIAHLLITYHIQVKDPKQYSGYNKMVIKQKTLERPQSKEAFQPPTPDQLKGW